MRVTATLAAWREADWARYAPPMNEQLPPSNEYTKALVGWMVSWMTFGMDQIERDNWSNNIRRIEKEIRESGPVDAMMADILAFGSALEAQLAGLSEG